MAVVLMKTPLKHVFDDLMKVVAGQVVETARFKIPLKRLEDTLKRIKPVFRKSRRLSKVLDRPVKETQMFIYYLLNAKEFVRKCSSIKYQTMCKKNLHLSKLIRLNRELLRYFQIQLQAKTMSSLTFYSLAENSTVTTLSAGGYLTTCSPFPGQLFNLPLMGSLANLSSIKFELVSVYSSIKPIFLLPFLQNLSFVMCEIGEYAFKNGITESPYSLSNLIDLEFDSCYELKKLPSGLCNLFRLQNLKITNCHELDALPRRLGNLLNLKNLDLHCCTKLQELPESIGSLQKLSSLDLSDCLSISILPEQIGDLYSLKVVKMSGVHGVQELPESMSKLLELEEVTCDEETSYLWMDIESDLYNLKISILEEDRFESFMKIVQ